MIVCPNCNHQNPEGATQCEACYTPLPATTSCPNCGTTVQTDASFCGQCGFNLKTTAAPAEQETSVSNPLPDLPDLMPLDPLITPDPIPASSESPMPATIVSQAGNVEAESTTPPPSTVPPLPEPTASGVATPPVPSSSTPTPPPIPATEAAKTQLQIQSVRLLHLQTNTVIELPLHLSVIHIGKPNDQIPPDIDVSGFPNSEIVSRVHADIRVEGDTYYIEDVGSANGTYINHTPLSSGNRHRLRTGDRISLGKGDLVTFLFQSS
ncbi:MAG TPA: peptide-binding protein [Cyanobacteria bacterium UBA8803]|nr:peptide-binding protein [Cyanobacteria bacterium UBA9273]HBL60168.1 peptide-binding protein [Cyanobacteria bacterium UBA8803]